MLVVVGFGVAKFLGQPVLPKQVVEALQAPQFAAPAITPQIAPNGGSAQAATGVRLLPDSLAARAGVLPATDIRTTPEPPRLVNSIAPVHAANEKVDVPVPPRMLDFGPATSAPIGESGGSRARLKNEAPRAVGVDPQSPVAIRRAPAVDIAASDPYKVPDSKPASSSGWSAPPLLNAGYSDAGTSSPTAIPASYAMPTNQPMDNQLAPPPWPMPDEASEPRTHIVADGDSLERLATLYLADPKRSREIFELNRDLLSAPDLLPIGAELKIPERLVAASWDRRGYQPNPVAVQSARDNGRQNMSPAQPAAGPQGIIPRAQLAPPMMVQ
jgi:nucleoid-associated protein YgaU